MNRRTMLKSLALGALAAVLPIRPTRAKATILTGCDAAGLGGKSHQMPGPIKHLYAVDTRLFVELTDGRCFVVDRLGAKATPIDAIPFRMLAMQPPRSVVRYGA